MSKQNKENKKPSTAKPSSAIQRKRSEVKLGSYLKTIAHGVGEGDGTNKLTISSQALAEVELLIEHAISNITHNAKAILKYSDAETIDYKTVRVATKLAFAGDLCDEADKAGKLAWANYEKASNAPKPVVAK
jgi:hypothetical protein